MHCGPMTATQRQQRKIEMSAEAVSAYMRANMIVRPSKAMSLNATLDDTDDILEDGVWFIDSFTKDGFAFLSVAPANNVLPITISGEQFVYDNTISIDGTRESTGHEYAIEAFEYAKNYL
ncbi:hypothetical protein F4703DRAFT_1943384 [Phycomyces blakesleeanus]